jgi:hypothetical protein
MLRVRNIQPSIRGVGHIQSQKVPRLQRSTILAIRLPALPGWADVWRGGPPGLGSRWVLFCGSLMQGPMRF